MIWPSCISLYPFLYVQAPVIAHSHRKNTPTLHVDLLSPMMTYQIKLKRITLFNSLTPFRKLSDACYQRALVAYKPKPAPQPTNVKQNNQPPAPSVVMILGLLKWLDNSLEKLMLDKQLTQDYHLQKHGIQVLTPKQIESHLKVTVPPPQTNNNNNADLESADDIQKEEESESEEEEEEAEEDGHVKVTASSSSFPGETSHKGTQVAIGSLELQGIGIVEIHTLNILFQCSRCRHQFQVALAPKADYAVECEKCHTAHIASLRPGTLIMISTWYLPVRKNA